MVYVYLNCMLLMIESIYLLSRGKSFRSRDIRTVISESLSECIVHARIDIRPETQMSLGLRRNVSGVLEAKKNGDRIVPIYTYGSLRIAYGSANLI